MERGGKALKSYATAWGHIADATRAVAMRYLRDISKNARTLIVGTWEVSLSRQIIAGKEGGSRGKPWCWRR